MPVFDAGPLPALDVLWLEDDDAFLDHAVGQLHEGSAAIPESVGLRFKPRIQRVSTLHEALAALPKNPDLIIIDLNLPDSQGADTMMEVRRAAPGTPMLVLTTVSDIQPAMMTAVEDAEFLDKDDLSPTRLVRAIYMAIMRANVHALPVKKQGKNIGEPPSQPAPNMTPPTPALLAGPSRLPLHDRQDRP